MEAAILIQQNQIIAFAPPPSTMLSAFPPSKCKHIANYTEITAEITTCITRLHCNRSELNMNKYKRSKYQLA